VSAAAAIDLDDDALTDLVTQSGGKAFQARQVAHWIYRHGATDWDGCKNVPQRLRLALAQRMPIRASRVVRTDASGDGTEKLLLALADGETVEAVVIPEGDRTTLCISTQVGCPVGCIFCASGMAGVRRNLTTGEIVDQVLHAKSRLPEGRALTNLVVMGMGEPLLNLDALGPALERIRDPEGIALGARRITVSTSGYPRQMEAFSRWPAAYNLAVSLHAADDGLRKRLVPTATHHVKTIIDAAARFFAKKGREVTFEVVLLENLNDRREDADAMIRALRGLPCTVNLIPWNPVEEIADLSRPSDARVDEFANRLRHGGLNVTVRRQRGSDRSAACGQLRIRALRDQDKSEPSRVGDDRQSEIDSP